MTKINLSTIGILLVLASSAPAQSRLDSFDSTTTTISEIILNPLPDGGCAARWTGSNVSADGGTTLTATTVQVELQAALAQGRCAGLAGNGIPKVNKVLRLDPDGGVP